MCDVAYGELRARVERQALAAQTVFASYDASGRYEMRGDMPSVGRAVEEFDAALEAPFETVMDADRELLELMGVR